VTVSDDTKVLWELLHDVLKNEEAWGIIEEFLGRTYAQGYESGWIDAWEALEE